MPRLVGTRWQGNAWVDGKRRRLTFDTKAEAEAYEAEPQLQQVKPVVGLMFLHGAKLIWSGTKNGNEAIRLTYELIRRLGEDTKVSTITTAKVQDLQGELIAEGNSRMTVNRKMATLSKLLKHCKDRGALSELPQIKFYQRDKGRIRYLTQVEEAALISPLAPHFQALANFLLYTGCRVGEAMSLDWADVGFDRVTFWVTKGNRPRTVPLVGKAPQALSHMQSLGKAKPFAWINYDAFHHAWTVNKQRAGLGSDTQVVPHILRHTCASRLVQGGADIVRVKEWMGHATVEQTMQYAHLAPASLFGIAHLLTAGSSDSEAAATCSDSRPVGVPEPLPHCPDNYRIT